MVGCSAPVLISLCSTEQKHDVGGESLTFQPSHSVNVRNHHRRRHGVEQSRCRHRKFVSGFDAMFRYNSLRVSYRMFHIVPEMIVCCLGRYFAGRMNLISETEAKGINTFVGTFSLPSLIFMSLAQLDLSSVNWLFLLSILISKFVVFVSVIVVTLLVGRPVNYGRAGIFGIFCTQSNDFAVGYPIGKLDEFPFQTSDFTVFSCRFIQKYAS